MHKQIIFQDIARLIINNSVEVETYPIVGYDGVFYYYREYCDRDRTTFLLHDNIFGPVRLLSQFKRRLKLIDINYLEFHENCLLTQEMMRLAYV